MEKTNIYHLLPIRWHDDDAGTLADHYKTIFASAIELYVLSAFLTEWPPGLKLSLDCRTFRIIIGTDFGTTRHAAVAAALKWLPVRFKNDMLAFNQKGVTFHPKVLMWRNQSGGRYLLVGSSNLTRAAFGQNVEANVTLKLTEAEFDHARAWIASLERRSIEINTAWLRKYQEAPIRGARKGGKKDTVASDLEEAPVFDLAPTLEDVADVKEFEEHLALRRRQRRAFDIESKKILEALFRFAASKQNWSTADNLDFFNVLWARWGGSQETRMGGDTWAILGKRSNHQELARAIVAILDAAPFERDKVVVAEKERLHLKKISTREAVLTELLCQFFPKDYPILDKPVRRWRSYVGFDKGVRGTEGERYLRLSIAMRATLEEAGPRSLGIKDLAELDTLIWCIYRKRDD